MTDKRSVKFWYIVITLILIVSGLVWASYIKAKNEAEGLLGSSQAYYQLNNVVLWTNFITDEEPLLWIFEFSNPPTIDNEFQVYVSIFGKVLLTNPSKLKERLINQKNRALLFKDKKE